MQAILGSSSGACPELELALAWLDVLFARDCEPAGGDAAAGWTGGAGQAGSQAAPGAQSAGPRLGTGSLYERTLLRLLEGLSSQLPPNRLIVKCEMRLVLAVLWLALAMPGILHAVALNPLTLMSACRVLLEAPALPMPAVQSFLQQAVGRGADWCTLALLAARDVILMRPPSRPPLLQLVLDSCCAAAPDTRSKAVRLVANRLFPEAGMAEQIESTARQRLDALLPAPPPAATSQGHEPGGEDVEMATEATEAAPAGVPGLDRSEKPPPQRELEQEGQQKQDGNAQSNQPPQPDLQQQAEPAGAPQPLEEPPPEADGPSDVEAAQLCALYCALCTKKHSLLRRLFEVYGQTAGEAAHLPPVTVC